MKTTAPDIDRHLTVPEAAAMAGMRDAETLRRHIRAGTGPKLAASWGASRKHRRILESEMRRWIGGR